MLLSILNGFLKAGTTLDWCLLAQTLTRRTPIPSVKTCRLMYEIEVKNEREDERQYCCIVYLMHRTKLAASFSNEYSSSPSQARSLL